MVTGDFAGLLDLHENTITQIFCCTCFRTMPFVLWVSVEGHCNPLFLGLMTLSPR